ncbi:MAG: oligoendopeptidase F [Clostridia bacterium]|nr:oligoendopeptidase F [Clostridia bacterium]
MECKMRHEMDPAFQWDFTHIFESKEAWEAAYAEAQTAVQALSTVPGTLGTSAASLKAGLDAVYGAAEKAQLVSLYAFLHKSGDNGNADYQTMEGRAMQLGIALSSALAFMEPEILAIDRDTLTAWMQSEELAGYRHILDDIVRGAAHVLDTEKEQMLALLGDAASSPRKCFDMLESVDMTFPTIHDENGKEVPLTHGSYGVYLHSRNAAVRKEAYETYFKEFGKYINTLAAMYAGSVKFDTFYARVRKYDSACEAALFGSNVPVAVYDSLTEAIHGGLPTMKRYLALRKKVLGMDTLNMYDLYCPMVDDVEFHVPFADGMDLVRKATAPLGARYKDLLDMAEANHWMDVYENKGKTTGAFSCGVHGVHPYVLLNYTDTLDDAYTLAHELGHAMHSYLSSEKQDFANHRYRILVAEVASTVNEVLLTKYLLSVETDKARRAFILNKFLEGFRTTVFRQTLFAEFERKAHDVYMAGQPLTAQYLNGLYRELNLMYYDGADVGELHDIEWARIPHFYNAFYVYQYATGFCSAVAIADRILKTGDASDYLKFLATGGSDYPIEELKIAGVDLTSPDTVANALKVFDETLSELEDLLA